jgi:hypothetical protein
MGRDRWGRNIVQAERPLAAFAVKVRVRVEMPAGGTVARAQGKFELAGCIQGAVNDALIFESTEGPVQGNPVNRAEQLLQVGLTNRIRTAQEYFQYLYADSGLAQFVALQEPPGIFLGHKDETLLQK